LSFMHEMSLAQNIVDIVQEEMTRHGVEKLQAINLAVGRMAAVVPQHLTFCFEIITENTGLAGTALHIREVPLTYRCLACGHEFTADEMAFICPECSEADPKLEKGRELTIENIEVAD